MPIPVSTTAKYKMVFTGVVSAVTSSVMLPVLVNFRAFSSRFIKIWVSRRSSVTTLRGKSEAAVSRNANPFAIARE